MNRKVLWLCEILAFVLTMHELKAWGPDIPIWTQGKIRCFDADYAFDGTKFVAFQPESSTEILFYESRNRGYSWTELFRYECYYPIGKIKIVMDDDTKELFVFYKYPDEFKLGSGLLTCFRFNWEDARTWTMRPPMVLHAVSKKPIIENSFDACIREGIIYATWEEEIDTNTKQLHVAKATRTTPHVWIDCMNQAISWSTASGTRVSIDAGSSSFVVVGYTGHNDSTGHTLNVLKSTTSGSTWESPVTYPHPTVPMYDPNVAVFGADSHPVWTAFNSDRGSHEIGLHVLTFSDHLWPTDVVIADMGDMDEYISDIEIDRFSSRIEKENTGNYIGCSLTAGTH